MYVLIDGFCASLLASTKERRPKRRVTWQDNQWYAAQ
jgi:hypothetical protein